MPRLFNALDAVTLLSTAHVKPLLADFRSPHDGLPTKTTVSSIGSIASFGPFCATRICIEEIGRPPRSVCKRPRAPRVRTHEGLIVVNHIELRSETWANARFPNPKNRIGAVRNDIRRRHRVGGMKGQPLVRCRVKTINRWRRIAASEEIVAHTVNASHPPTTTDEYGAPRWPAGRWRLRQ